MTWWDLARLLAGLYVVNTLSFVSAYALTEWWAGYWSDRRWRRERTATLDAHAKAQPRGGKR